MVNSKSRSAGGIARILSSREQDQHAHLSADQLKSLLDSLPNHIALLDGSGEILLVNAAWKEFAIENGMTREDSETGNYLEVCEKAAKQGDEVAHQTLEGLRAVLIGESKVFEMEYPCHSPVSERWFRINAASVILWGDRCAVVTHSNLTRNTAASKSA